MGMVVCDKLSGSRGLSGRGGGCELLLAWGRQRLPLRSYDQNNMTGHRTSLVVEGSDNRDADDLSSFWEVLVLAC